MRFASQTPLSPAPEVARGEKTLWERLPRAGQKRSRRRAVTALPSVEADREERGEVEKEWGE